MTETRADLILAESRGDVSALRKVLGASDPSLRSLALGSLAKLNALDSGDLREALTDEAATVRCRAIDLAIPEPSIDLVPALDDQDDLVVETAAWALGEREVAAPEIIDRLSALAADHDVSICREAAIAALGAIGAERGLPAILAGMQDRAPVRRRAVLALAPFASPEVTAALTTALTDRDRQVRQAAEDLLG